MKSLHDLTIRTHQYKRGTVGDLPIKLTYEERKKSWTCKAEGYYVSAFTCLQCKHYEVHNERVRVVTKVTGTCKFPRVASRKSRKITKWSPFGRNGTKGKGKKKSGGMSDKVDFAIELMQEGNDRQTTIRRLIKKFSIGKGYAASVQYQAKKAIEEDK